MAAKILFFWILLIGISTQWEKPVRISESGKALSLYVDPQSHLSHALWRGFGSFSSVGPVFYSQVPENGAPKPKVILDPKGRESFRADIVGIAGSQTLVVAMDMYRESCKGQCNAYTKETKGCVDTFVTISYDNGASWSEPQAVPREEENDFAGRYSPSVIHIKEVNRVLISYTYDGIDGKKIGLAAWQVAADGKLYSCLSQHPHQGAKELFGPTISSTVMPIVKLGYTVDPELDVRLRLVWQQSSLDGQTGIFVTALSSDLGATWQQREVIGTFGVLARTPLFSIAAYKEDFAVSFSDYQGKVKVVIYGKEGKIEKDLPNRVYGVASCLVGGRLHVMQNAFYFLRYGYVDLEKKTYVPVDDEVYPMRYAAGTERMACFEAAEGKLGIKALANVDFWPAETKGVVELLQATKEK